MTEIFARRRAYSHDTKGKFIALKPNACGTYCTRIRRRVPFELTIEKRDRARSEMAGQTMHRDAGIDRIGKATRGSPDVHHVAGARQFNRNPPRIVTHSAGLRRIAAGYDMPMLQAEVSAKLNSSGSVPIHRVDHPGTWLARDWPPPASKPGVLQPSNAARSCTRHERIVVLDNKLRNHLQ